MAGPFHIITYMSVKSNTHGHACMDTQSAKLKQLSQQTLATAQVRARGRSRREWLVATCHACQMYKQSDQGCGAHRVA